MQRSTIDAVGQGCEACACVGAVVVSTVVGAAFVVVVVVVAVVALLSPITKVSIAKHHVYSHEIAEPATLLAELMSRGSGS